MNLTSVRYQESHIYIGLNGSQDGGEYKTFQHEIRNVYVVYKIKTPGHHVQETVLISKRDVFKKERKILLKLEMNDLLNPNDCEIEILSIKLNFENKLSRELTIGRTFSFIEICYSSRVEFPARKPSRKVTFQDARNVKKIANIPLKPEAIIAKTPKKPNKKKIEEKAITPGGFVVVEEITPVLKMTEKIESKMPVKVDVRTKKLDMDIKKLCLQTIDLLLANLPLPELAEEYRSSSVMVKSIHRYINDNLLEDHHDGGESV